MKKKVIIFGTLVMFLIIAGAYFLIGFPLLVVEKSDSPIVSKIPDTIKKGDIIAPLKGYDLDKGTCKAYIIISRSDFANLPVSIKKKKVLQTDDCSILKQLINDFRFVYTGADVSTCESRLYIFHDDKMIFRSSIVIEDNRIGLQNNYGWIEAVDSKRIIESIKQFKPVYSPLIIL